MELEQSLVFFFLALCGPGSLGRALLPDSFGNLQSACVAMVKVADLPPEWREALLDCLAEAQRLTGERNRLVHDRWLPVVSDEGRHISEEWARMRSKKNRPAVVETRRTLADLRRTIGQLEVLIARFGMLPWSIPVLLGNNPLMEDFVWPPGLSSEVLLQMAQGHIEMQDGGGYVSQVVPRDPA